MARALIPNSTQVPDVILDRWMARLSGAEFKVLMYVARRTYGFGKDSDDISLNQIARGIRRRDGRTLDEGTGLSRSGVKAACAALIRRGVLVRLVNRSGEGRECEESTYRLNLYAALPEVGRIPAHPGRKEARVGRTEPASGPPADRGVGLELAPQETAPQETQQHPAGGPADRNPMAEIPDADAAILTNELVAHGVGRAVAAELAARKPEACRRYLEYLPFTIVRTTPGAWLASAIRDEYGPPPGFLKTGRPGPSAGPAPGAATARCQGMIDDRVRSAYHRLEQDQPEVFAAFREYLMAERERTERFAARLSLRRRAEHLAAFDTDEYRLELFGRWIRSQPLLPKGGREHSQHATATLNRQS